MQRQRFTHELRAAVTRFEQLTAEEGNLAARERIAALRDSVSSDFYSIVFLGEFNRGKSSLINALLGTTVLPMDVTPTTAAIHVLRFSGTPLIRMHQKGGSYEDLSWHTEALKHSAGNAQIDRVSYIEIGLPAATLREGIVLVDTPGIDDLDAHRIDVTHRFVPRADAVVFVLSAQSALNRSEIEFLQTSVLKSGISRIVFALNFIDLIDEDEREDLISSVRNKLNHIFPTIQINLVAVSARRGIAGVRSVYEPDKDSGIAGLAEAIEALRETRHEEKFLRLRNRLAGIIGAAIEELEAVLTASSATEEALARQMQSLDGAVAERSARRGRLQAWLQGRQRDVRLMIGKSCDTLNTRLETNILEQIEAYTGPTFEDFFNVQVPRKIKAELNQWAETHTPPLTFLVRRFAEKLSFGLSRSFNAAVAPLRDTGSWGGLTDVSFALPAISVPNASYKVGLLGGGAAALLYSIGATVFVPLLAMAAVPVVRDFLHKRNLSDAKRSAVPIVQEAITTAVRQLREEASAAFEHEMTLIGAAAQDRFENLIDAFRREIACEIERRRDEKEHVAHRRTQLNATISSLKDLKEELINTGINTSKAPESTALARV